MQMLKLHLGDDVKGDAKKLSFEKLRVAVRKAFVPDPALEKFQQKQGKSYFGGEEEEYEEETWKQEESWYADWTEDGYGCFGAWSHNSPSASCSYYQGM